MTQRRAAATLIVEDLGVVEDSMDAAQVQTRGITSAALGVSRAFRPEADVATARRRAPRLGRGARAQLGKADCGGLRDETGLAGHNETWKDAHPGMILREVRRLGSRDPVFVLDGVDKARPGLAAVASTVPLTPSHRAARVRSGWRSAASAQRRPAPAAAAQEEGRERGRVHTTGSASDASRRCAWSGAACPRSGSRVRCAATASARRTRTRRCTESWWSASPTPSPNSVRGGVGRHRAYGYGMV